jgi:hypothetical protein
MALWSDYFRWTWAPFRRVPIEVGKPGAPAPAPTAPAANEQPRTAGQYNTFGVGAVSLAWNAWCPCPDVPPGDYPVWRAMDSDPALTLSRGVITAPIREADKGYKAREGTPDEWVKFVQGAIDPLWPEFLRESLDALSMGWKPFERILARREGRTVVADLKPLAQELTAVLVKEGAYAGLRNDAGQDNKAVDLSPAASLIVTVDGKNRDPYGRPWHENARRDWWNKLQRLNALAKLAAKASGIQPKVHYPPAADEVTAHTNETKAKTLAQNYMKGDGVVLPNAAGSLTTDLAADFRNIQGLAEAALWKIEIEDFGDTGKQAAALIDECRYYNVEMSRGWHVPERAAQEGEHGTKAESEQQSQVNQAMSQLVYNDICAAASRQAIDGMLVENFGEKARGAVWIDPGKLRDVFAAADWRLIDTVLKDGDLFLAVAEQVDLDAVFTRRGIPKLKSVLTLNEAVAERRKQKEQERKQQQELAEAKVGGGATGANGSNGNGKGRFAMARGVEWLGRMIDGAGLDE